MIGPRKKNGGPYEIGAMWGPAPPSRFDISITQPVGRSDHFLHIPTCHDFATCRLFLLCPYTIHRYALRPNDQDGAGHCGFSGWGGMQGSENPQREMVLPRLVPFMQDIALIECFRRCNARYYLWC
ncbi:hypothetical protein NPIL_431051 [Nephila pilipes]|uniref:Uncharacterized protein n=1 Tax=Nephila pilipes TaxID=299642 RepID=A0A8X6QPP5_NEPPI|nr:hypothetical protein NPIL_431051 [Nephila pilipes]